MRRTKQVLKVGALGLLMGVVAFVDRQTSFAIAASAADQSLAEQYPADAPRELLVQLAREANVRGSSPRSGLGEMDEHWAALGAIEVIPVFQLDPTSEVERELGLGRFFLVRLTRGVDAFVSAREFEALPEVEWAEPSTVGRKLCTPYVHLDPRLWSYVNPGFNLNDTTDLMYRFVFHLEKARVEGGAQIDEVRLQGVPGAFPPPGGWKPEGPVTVTLVIEGNQFEADEEEASICEMTQR